MMRFAGSNEARSNAPAAVVHPGTGISRTVVRFALGVGVCAGSDAATHREITTTPAKRKKRVALTDPPIGVASRRQLVVIPRLCWSSLEFRVEITRRSGAETLNPD